MAVVSQSTGDGLTGADLLVVAGPPALVAVGLIVFAFRRQGLRGVVTVMVIPTVGLFVMQLAPFPVGLLVIVALTPVFLFGLNYFAIRRVGRATMVPVDLPPVPPAAEPVLAELAAYGFAVAGAVRVEPTVSAAHLVLVNEGAAMHASVGWTKTATVNFSITSDLVGGGQLVTTRIMRLMDDPSVLRQCFIGRAPSQLVTQHLGALEFLASRGVFPVPPAADGAMVRVCAQFEADQAKAEGSALAVAWAATWRSLLRQPGDIGPLWGQPDIEAKLSRFGAAVAR